MLFRTFAVYIKLDRMKNHESQVSVRVALPVVLVVLHAALILGALVARQRFEWDGFSATPWMVFAWLWLLWPLSLFWPLNKNRKVLVVALLLGAALLMPAVPTLFTFTTWSIGGFAP